MKNFFIILGAIAVLLIGIRFGLITGLVGAFFAGLILKKYGIVSADSAWVKETKGVKIAKYVLLSLVILALLAYAFFVLF
jgi:hypothetical protein